MSTTMTGSECVYEEGRRIYNTVLCDLSLVDLAKVYAYALHKFGDDPRSKIILDELNQKQGVLDQVHGSIDELTEDVDELKNKIYDLEDEISNLNCEIDDLKSEKDT